MDFVVTFQKERKQHKKNPFSNMSKHSLQHQENFEKIAYYHLKSNVCNIIFMQHKNTIFCNIKNYLLQLQQHEK
jgi:hypothetical protein